MNTTKCPVCDWDINDGGINVKVGGKEITVCCDDCAKKAEADQFAIAFTGKWRDLRYGTGSGSDLAPPGAATTEAPGRYRSLYRTAAVPYTQLKTDIVAGRMRLFNIP